MKILLWVETGFANGRHEDEIEIDDSELDGMTPEERENHLSSYAEDYMWNCGIEYGYTIQD